MRLDELRRLYDEYVDTYREEGGALPSMMQLKRAHTGFVVKNATLIADGEGFDDLEPQAGLDVVAGLQEPDVFLLRQRVVLQQESSL